METPNSTFVLSEWEMMVIQHCSQAWDVSEEEALGIMIQQFLHNDERPDPVFSLSRSPSPSPEQEEDNDDDDI